MPACHPYYVSKDGGYLMKYSDPTANQIEAWKKASFWKHQTTGVIKKANKQPSKMWNRVPAPHLNHREMLSVLTLVTK